MSAKSPGEKRRRAAKRAREAAAYRAALAALPADATCNTCKYIDRVHVAPRFACELESDFHGYQLVTLTHRCTWWKRRTP